MTAKEQQHKLTHDRIVASLILADTRSERHGTYPKRRPPRKAHVFVFPAVTERAKL